MGEMCIVPRSDLDRLEVARNDLIRLVHDQPLLRAKIIDITGAMYKMTHRKYDTLVEPEPEVITCSCGQPGSPRFEGGLPCGTHCQVCFDQMVDACRSRSY